MNASTTNAPAPPVKPAISPQVQETLNQIDVLIAEMRDLRNASAVLHLDLETQMPPKGIMARSGSLSRLSKLLHVKSTSPELGKLIRSLKEPATFNSLPPLQQRLVSQLWRGYEQSTKLPGEFVERLTRETTKAQQAWEQARAKGEFELFRPNLETLVSLTREKANYLGASATKPAYDCLLDEFEPDLTMTKLDPLFTDLKKELVPLLNAIKAAPKPDKAFLKKHYDTDLQMKYVRQMIEDLGFDFERGALAKSAHPFSSEVGGPDDVRITTRTALRDPMNCILGAAHETGHGMYEQGISKELPIGLQSAISLGIHESQSRTQENHVGKSRPFWQHQLPKLKKFFPKALKGVTLEKFYKAINEVKPSFIRTESDEVTYNLHIMLRYELEKDIINGKLDVTDIPKAWNAKMKEYFGIVPKSDSEGCLQDVHWAHGAFGYFPTYTLGNLYAAQFYHQAQKELPNLETQMAKGNLKPFKNWLNEKIHKIGDSRSADQLVMDVTGEPLNAKYFVNYLWEKYGKLYNIQHS